MAAAVMSDAAISAGRQKEHLVLEGVRAQRPPMAEDHGLSATPVLVVEIYVACVFLADSNVWHGDSPFLFRRQSVHACRHRQTCGPSPSYRSRVGTRARSCSLCRGVPSVSSPTSDQDRPSCPGTG